MVLLVSGMIAHVMTFEVGAVLEDEKWQAPVYCFPEAKGFDSPLLEHDHHHHEASLTRGMSLAIDAM